MKGLGRLVVLISLFAFQAYGSEVVETFSNRDHLESGSAVWNQALGKIHPQLQAVNYKPGATALPFSVGDGSDGSFDPSTYAKFSLNGDTSGFKIRFDTSRFPILKVTSFHLAPGWKLEPVGNSPLIIYSLSTVKIEGEIWCHGKDGGDASGSTPGAGGQGRCGGKSGGNGGAVGANGADGENASASVTGGHGGPASGVDFTGGGGGGSWHATGTTQANDGYKAGGFTGGLAGTSASDPEFTILAGGAGGGGGSGTTTEAGAGGGAGGGVVIIHAVGDVEIGTSPTSVSGYILANGGNGGNASATASPGGGGAGGSVKIFSGGTISIFNSDVNGASQAIRGNSGSAGGVGATATGNGSDGRNWFASVNYTAVAGGTYNPGEEAPVQANNNTVEFTNTAQSVITKSIDLESTLATLDSTSLTPTSADFSLEFRGSNDDFASDDTGWTTDLSLLAHKRFVKIKANVQTSTPSNPTMLDEVKITFTPGQRKDFQFKTSGCAFVGPTDSNGPWNLLLILLPLLFLAALQARAVRFLKSN